MFCCEANLRQDGGGRPRLLELPKGRKKCGRNREDGVVANVAEAIKNCFWDKVAKDQSITHFDADDFFKKIAKVIKFHSDETKSKGDEHAMEAVLKMKNYFKSTAPHVTIN